MLGYTMEDLKMNAPTVTAGFLEVAGLRWMGTGMLPSSYPSNQFLCRLLFIAVTASNEVMIAVTKKTVNLECFLEFRLHREAGYLGLYWFCTMVDGRTLIPGLGWSILPIIAWGLLLLVAL